MNDIVLSRGTTALVLVDLQNDNVHPEAEKVANREPEQPVTDDVHQHRRAGVAQPPENSRCHCLRAIEQQIDVENLEVPAGARGYDSAGIENGLLDTGLFLAFGEVTCRC